MADQTKQVKQAKQTQRCPICGAPTRQAFRPFCSRRCADVDLGRWLRGAYRVPTDEAPGEAPGDNGGGPEDDGA